MRVPDDEAMQTTRNLHAGVPCGVSRASVRGNPKRRASQLVIVRAQEHTMPPDPVVTTRDLGEMWRWAAAGAGALAGMVAAAFLGSRRR